MQNLNLDINFDDVASEEVDGFTVENAKGVPAFAASCECPEDSCDCCCCCCQSREIVVQ